MRLLTSITRRRISKLITIVVGRPYADEPTISKVFTTHKRKYDLYLVVVWITGVHWSKVGQIISAFRHEYLGRVGDWVIL